MARISRNKEKQNVPGVPDVSNKLEAQTNVG